MRLENVKIEKDNDENDIKVEQKHYKFKRHKDTMNRIKNAFDKEAKVCNDDH